tara:strand:+ start:13037 stop:13897 length:861 start_codon:yes stop_codon:yes gene_type:complete
VKVETLKRLDRIEYSDIVAQALTEDIGGGDITTAAMVPPQQRAVGELIVQEPFCVLAGVDIAVETFMQVDSNVRIDQLQKDGELFSKDTVVLRIEGSADSLLKAERTALNFLQWLSGVATLARKYVDAADGKAVIMDTRKTIPTLRTLQKYAVRVGGGENHRYSLEDGLLIKDNHIQVVGSLRHAVKSGLKTRQDKPVEVEAESLEEVQEAVAAGADIILLDNMSTRTVREAVKMIDKRAAIEVSGGISIDRTREIALTGVDFISVGALTHSAPAVNCSFTIKNAS